MADDMETLQPFPTKGGGGNVPMPEEDEQYSDSSTDEEQEPVDSETATSEQAIEGQEAQDETTPFHQHPRWQEREQEWNAKLERLEKEAEESRRLAASVIDKFQSPQAPQAPQQDAWEGLVNHPDPATAQWYQDLRSRTERTIDSMVERKLGNVMQAVDAGRQELAQIKITQFRKENPDIKPNSPEEAKVINGLQQGFDLETSRRLALFDKYERENAELKGKRSATPRKVAANASEHSSGIPQRSGLPNRRGDWRDNVSETIDKGGSITDAFNTVFGRKR